MNRTLRILAYTILAYIGIGFALLSTVCSVVARGNVLSCMQKGSGLAALWPVFLLIWIVRTPYLFVGTLVILTIIGLYIRKRRLAEKLV